MQYIAKDDGKARRRKKMGMVTSEAEEVRLLILRTLSMGFSRQEYWSGVPSPSLSMILACPSLTRTLQLPPCFQLLPTPENQLLIVSTQEQRDLSLVE